MEGLGRFNAVDCKQERRVYGLLYVKLNQIKIKQMKILKEGHLYELENFENKDAEGQKIQFI